MAAKNGTRANNDNNIIGKINGMPVMRVVSHDMIVPLELVHPYHNQVDPPEVPHSEYVYIPVMDIEKHYHVTDPNETDYHDIYYINGQRIGSHKILDHFEEQPLDHDVYTI